MLEKPEEVDHEYESEESKRMLEKQLVREIQPKEGAVGHKMGREEINILDQAVMNSFKKHLSEVEEAKQKQKSEKEAHKKEQQIIAQNAQE